MTRTTPPRPLDLLAEFPETAALARPTVRLHPRPGAPGPADSSIGGPLRWPATEPWPVCAEHAGTPLEGRSPADVHTYRAIIGAAWRRDPDSGPDRDEQAVLAAMDDEQAVVPDGPVPMVAVAQLYASDVPELPFPDGHDMLQVLWCPFSHPDDYEPRVTVRWRSAAAVGAELAQPPQPEVVDEGYLPEPCVLHPEVVTEFPQDITADQWERFEDLAAAAGCEYQYDLSVAPGCKVGGYAPWSITDPFPVSCTECGADAAPLLTFDSSEWDGGSSSWRPVEDARDDEPMFASAANSTQLMIGRSNRLQLYVCTASTLHPVIQNLQ